MNLPIKTNLLFYISLLCSVQACSALMSDAHKSAAKIAAPALMSASKGVGLDAIKIAAPAFVEGLKVVGSDAASTLTLLGDDGVAQVAGLSQAANVFAAVAVVNQGYTIAKDAVYGAQALKSYYFPSAVEIQQAEDARALAVQTRERLNMLLAKKRFREALFGNADEVRDPVLGIPIVSLEARRELLQNGGVVEAAEMIRIFTENFPQRAPDAPRYNPIQPVQEASRCIIS